MSNFEIFLSPCVFLRTLYDHLPQYVKKHEHRTGAFKYCCEFERKMMLIRDRMGAENFDRLGFDPTLPYRDTPTREQLKELKVQLFLNFTNIFLFGGGVTKWRYYTMGDKKIWQGGGGMRTKSILTSFSYPRFWWRKKTFFEIDETRFCK